MAWHCHNMQNLENDCGYAVVKTILQKYRKNSSFKDLFSDVPLALDGYSIFDLENEGLNHYIVCHKVKKASVIISGLN